MSDVWPLRVAHPRPQQERSAACTPPFLTAVADDDGPHNEIAAIDAGRVRGVADATAVRSRRASVEGDTALIGRRGEAPDHARTCPEEGNVGWDLAGGVGDHRSGWPLLAPPIVLRRRSHIPYSLLYLLTTVLSFNLGHYA